MAHQLHYTSVPAGVTGRSGFQFVARSAGASPELEPVIERFMTYRPPIGTHSRRGCPVSLAYDQTPHGAVLVCCRYLGIDYTGRPGNFLGHAVVAQPDELDGLRPIELWRAPFWSAAPSQSLPALSTLSPGTAIDPDRVRELLQAAGDAGYRMLAALLDAVRATLAGQAGPIALVSEDVERIALWIAAVSYSLPIAVSRRLSFITYTADPRLARYHLVGTTPHAWTGCGGDGVAYHLDTLSADDCPEPSPYAATVVTAWRAGDLAELDALCATATDAIEVMPPPATARGGALDAAAGLLSLCRGVPVDEPYASLAVRLLDGLREPQRARVLDRAAASLTRADGGTVDALLAGSGGARLADLLVDRDWSAAPQVGTRLYATHARRHRERRGEMVGKLLDLTTTDGDAAETIRDLWRDANPTATEAIALLDIVDASAKHDPVIRDLVGDIVARALRAADLSDPQTRDLAEAVAHRLATLTTIPPSSRAAAHLIRAVSAVRDADAHTPPEQVAGWLDQLAEWHASAPGHLARDALRDAVAWLTDRTPEHCAWVLRHAAPATRALLVEDWLSHTPDDPRARVDIAEVAVRLRAAGIREPALTGYLLELVRRPFAFRKVHRALTERQAELGDELRALVTEAGGGWRAVFRRPAGG